MTAHFEPELKIYENDFELCTAVVAKVIERIHDGLILEGIFHLALTGGTIGTLVTEGLVTIWNQNPSDFSGLHIWWGDERYVPESSQERNARPVVQHLSSGEVIQVHAAPSSDIAIDLDTAAREYRETVAGIAMDLILLGVGPDGHVASLFPGHWSKGEKNDVIAVRDSPKLPPLRVSFSMAKINESESVWLLAMGENKRHAVIEIFARDKAVPAAFVHGRRETLLFLDRAANPSQ